MAGPIWKDKIFFFLNGEHIKQDALTPVTPSGPFVLLRGGFPLPFARPKRWGVWIGRSGQIGGCSIVSLTSRTAVWHRSEALLSSPLPT